MAQKWNNQKRKYSPYKLPEGCILYTDDLDKKCSCCQCGKTKTYGEMFTSREVHNNYGLGYPTCEDCYKLERQKS